MVEYWNFCRTHYDIAPRRRLRVYRIRLEARQTVTRKLYKLIKSVFLHIPFHFKTQVSFVILLRNRIDNSRKIFYSSFNSFGIFKRMRLIHNAKSRNKVLREIKTYPLEIFLSKQYTKNSKWVLERIVSVTVFGLKIY